MLTLENMVEILKIEDIYARTLREESRQEGVSRKRHDGDLLQAVQHRGRTKVCFCCGKRGHIARNCWHNEEGRNYKPILSKISGRNNRTRVAPRSGHAFVAKVGSDKQLEESWFLDSGASYHMTSNPIWISENTRKAVNPVEIRPGNGTIVEGREMGEVKLAFKCGEKWCPITVKNVLIVPELKANLLSVGLIQEKWLSSCLSKE